MRVEEFSNALFEELIKELSKTNEENNNILEISRTSSTIILRYISRLKKFVNNYNFQNHAEEINFFKNIKPKFLEKLIYFQKIYKI